jgi:hypothetical protein
MDIKAKCGEVHPGEGRMGTCLKEHLTELSQRCQARLARFAVIGKTGKACVADIKQICPDIKPERGRSEACVKSALTKLSEPCKDAIAKAAAGAR